MAWADVKHHYEERDDEPERVTVPADAKEGDLFMVSADYGLWDVYGWAPGECRACRGACSIPEPNGEPMKCGNCRGTGSDHNEPEVIASGLHEMDARFIVFGRKLLTACAQSLPMVRLLSAKMNQPKEVTDTIEAIRAAIVPFTSE